MLKDNNYEYNLSNGTNLFLFYNNKWGIMKNY